MAFFVIDSFDLWTEGFHQALSIQCIDLCSKLRVKWTTCKFVTCLFPPRYYLPYKLRLHLCPIMSIKSEVFSDFNAWITSLARRSKIRNTDLSFASNAYFYSKSPPFRSKPTCLCTRVLNPSFELLPGPFCITTMTPNHSTMAKSNPPPENTMTHLQFFRKFKRLNPLEPSLAILGFFFVTILFICGIFYFDYRSIASGLRNSGTAWLGLRISSSSSMVGDALPGFLDEGGDGCDVFDGNWVWDDSYPLYQSQTCSFLDEGFRCNEKGRLDVFYTKWRWQPKNCNLPRFLVSFFVL